MRQTAIDWLVEQLDEQVFRIDHVERRINISISFEDMMTLKKQAKEMEKEQIILAHGKQLKKTQTAGNYEYWLTGQQYYNETYK